MNFTNEEFNKMEYSANLELEILKLIDKSELELKDIAQVLSKLTNMAINKM